MQYSLDIEEIKQIPFDKYERDFTFIVNGKEFQTNRILADLLSPIIRRSHLEDSTLNTFNIKFTDIDLDINREEFQECPLETYFPDFLKLFNFSKIELDDKHQIYYSLYFYALGNIKEYFRLRSGYFEGITIENVLSKIDIISKIERKFYTKDKIDGYFKLIEFASEHFEELNREEMKKLYNEDIEEIIKHENLQLDNEDSLIEFILQLYSEDESKSKLFEYVLFSNVSEEMINQFISVFNINDLDNETWKSICVRLSKTSSEDKNHSENRYKESKNSKNNKINKSDESKSIQFELDSNNKFNGILKYLSDKTGGNIVDNGTISLTADSEDCPVKNMIRFDSTDYYRHLNQSMEKILFDFKNRSVKISKYSIHTGTYNTNGGHLKSWVLEGSNDNEHWEEIDNRSNDSSLNGNRYSSSFEAQQKRNEFYRFIRLRQTGIAWCPQSDNRFEIRYIEFFGFLTE